MTRLGIDVGRAAGFYEQCDHRDPSDRIREGAERLGALPGSVVARGLVGRPGIIPHPTLRSIAGSDRVSDFDTRIVPVADLFGQVRLDVSAELVMWHTPDGRQVVTPIARLLEGAGSYLVLGGDEKVRPQWSQPVVLRAEGLPGDVEIEVVALTAMTFAEFVGTSSEPGPS